jgi:predicted O-linked N-acetylglucosamine transferase (SPINDLY family)
MKKDLLRAEKMLKDGQLGDAKVILERLISEHPQDPQVAYEYGNLLLQLNENAKALDYLKQAISSENSDPCWLVMGAVALQRNGLYSQAENAFKAAEYGGCKSDLFYYFCGNFHTNITRDFDQAEYHYLKLIAQNPKANVGLIGLSRLYNLQKRYDESIQAAEACLANGYESAEVYINLGAALIHQGRQEISLSCYEKALEIDPGSNIAIQNYLQQLLFIEEDQEKIHRTVCKLVEPLNSITDISSQHQPEIDQQRRIRLGFVSADLHYHAIGFFLKPILEKIDKESFEVYIYYNNVVVDAVTDKIKQVADKWYDCMSLSDAEMNERIRKDRIDILIDLSNHTSGNRLAVFATKPAPIQIAWMGIPISTGLKCMDYWIRDKEMVSGMKSQHYASEAILPISNLIVYDPILELPDVVAPPVVQNGYITFGYYNGMRKATDTMFSVWAQILNAIPDSKIRIIVDDYDNQYMQDHVFEKFEHFNVSRDRVLLQKRLPLLEYLKSYNEIDIALDPFPYNGQTTTMNSLQMGVPVVTCQGSAMASLYTATILTRLGKKQWIAKNLQQYFKIAVDLAGDLAQLQASRYQLRDEVNKAYFKSKATTVNNIETALRSVWRDYCCDVGAKHS